MASSASSVHSATSSRVAGTTSKHKTAPTAAAAKDAKKDAKPEEATGRGTRQAAKEEREKKKAEEEKKKAEQEEAKARIKKQQEEIRLKKEAEAQVKAAIDRRQKGAERLIQRNAASSAASKALKEQAGIVHDSAVAVAEQAAWSRLYAAAKDNNLELLAQLLRPHEHVEPPKDSKRQKFDVGVRVNVDWACEALRGGGGNDRGYWSVNALKVNARGGVMRRTALITAAACGHLQAVTALCDEYGADMNLVDAGGRCALWCGQTFL